MGRFTGFNMLVALAMAAGLILVHLTLAPAIKTHLADALLSINSSFASQYNYIFGVWDWIFYILFFGIIAYMVVNVVRGERQEYYGGGGLI